MAEAEKKAVTSKPSRDEEKKKKTENERNHRVPKYRGRKLKFLLNKKKKMPTKKKQQRPKKNEKPEPKKKELTEEERRKLQSRRDKWQNLKEKRKEKVRHSRDRKLLEKLNTAVQRETKLRLREKKLAGILKHEREARREAEGKPKREGKKRPPAKKLLKIEKLRKKKERKQKKQFKRRKYVQIGTVVNILHGSSRNTLAVIVDILDNHWVMIDGKCFKQDKLGKPSPRRMMNIKDLLVTPFRIRKVFYRMRASKIARLAKRQRIMLKWKKTKMYSTIQKRRAKRWSTDLERWRVQYNRKQRAALVKAEFLKLKKKVLELAAAATKGKRVFNRHLHRKGLLPPEREFMKNLRTIKALDPFKPKKKRVWKDEEEDHPHPLELIPKPKKPTKPPKKTEVKEEKKPKAKKKPAAKPGSKPGSKAKPAAKKGKESAAKEKPKGKEKAAAAAKPAAKKAKPAKPAAK